MYRDVRLLRTMCLLALVLFAPGSAMAQAVIAGTVRFGGTRTMIGVDIYNALNSSAILTYNNTFVPGGTWLQPNSILTGRMTKISAEFTF
jgi:hypothetical protein